MGWVVAAIIGVVAAVAGFFGFRQKFTRRGYDRALSRQSAQADMVRKELERKDAAIDLTVEAEIERLRKLSEERLTGLKTGQDANDLFARTRLPWRRRKS